MQVALLLQGRSGTLGDNGYFREDIAVCQEVCLAVGTLALVKASTSLYKGTRGRYNEREFVNSIRYVLRKAIASGALIGGLLTRVARLDRILPVHLTVLTGSIRLVQISTCVALLVITGVNITEQM
jgi:hypothetical protein